VAAPPIKAPAAPPRTAPLAAFWPSGVLQPASETATAKAAERGISLFIFSNSESVAQNWPGDDRRQAAFAATPVASRASVAFSKAPPG
jgi:hypothetical protein